MTVLFAYARGFTGRAELDRGNPQGLTRLVNRLLTPISRDIVQYKGTIDKYMGDAVMAFWNAPLDDRDHAANACRAALAMTASVARLNEERAQEAAATGEPRSEEHTSELQSLMRISYAVFCLKKKTTRISELDNTERRSTQNT